jgi:S1-C subfamily serine protease
VADSGQAGRSSRESPRASSDLGVSAGAVMPEARQLGESAKRRSNSHVLTNVGLVAGLAVLIAGQLILFRLTTQRRTRTLDSQPNPLAPAANVGGAPGSSPMQLVSYADADHPDAVAAVRPAIVNIDVASSDVGPESARRGLALSFDLPQSQALGVNEETLGSGIVVDGRGYILTCHHLIERHPTIYVTVFSCVRKTYEAEVVDVDVANDLALLRIFPDSPLPAAQLADSDMVKTTDSVLAIGSPFGFEHTVTEGIISDNKRSVAINGVVYQDLFQTDASINRGSAGGALVNGEGAVIGVNTAIASASGCFSGISFAIPINRARPLLLKAIEER